MSKYFNVLINNGLVSIKLNNYINDDQTLICIHITLFFNKNHKYLII